MMHVSIILTYFIVISILICGECAKDVNNKHKSNKHSIKKKRINTSTVANVTNIETVGSVPSVSTNTSTHTANGKSKPPLSSGNFSEISVRYDTNINRSDRLYTMYAHVAHINNESIKNRMKNQESVDQFDHRLAELIRIDSFLSIQYVLSLWILLHSIIESKFSDKLRNSIRNRSIVIAIISKAIDVYYHINTLPTITNSSNSNSNDYDKKVAVLMSYNNTLAIDKARSDIRSLIKTSLDSQNMIYTVILWIVSSGVSRATSSIVMLPIILYEVMFVIRYSILCYMMVFPNGSKSLLKSSSSSSNIIKYLFSTIGATTSATTGGNGSVNTSSEKMMIAANVLLETFAFVVILYDLFINSSSTLYQGNVVVKALKAIIVLQYCNARLVPNIGALSQQMKVPLSSRAVNSNGKKKKKSVKKK